MAYRAKKKWRFISIRYKFLVVSLSLSTIALGLFFYFTYQVFTADKKLFLLDLNLTNLRAITSEIQLALKSRLEALQVLIPRVYHQGPGSSGFTNVYQNLPPELINEILGIHFYRFNHRGEFFFIKDYQNETLFKKLGLPRDFLSHVNQVHPLSFSSPISINEFFLLNRSIRDRTATKQAETQNIGVLTFVVGGSYINSSSLDFVVAADFLQSFIQRKLMQTDLSEVFLLFQNGTLLSSPNTQDIVDFASHPISHPIVPILQRNVLPRESFEITMGDEPYFCQVSYTGFPFLYAVTQIKKSAAFQALRELSIKSLLIYGFVLGITLVLSVIFANRMSQNIRQLGDAAMEISQGNFNQHLRITSHDEIQIVSESIEWMSSKLVGLIEESVEQIRMKQELETAKLIQSTLLSHPPFHHHSVDLTNYYLPASECGGDLWDFAVTEDHVLTALIGDATGHGAPAAIVTAVVKSCFNTLVTLYSSTATPRPEQFLQVFNQIVYQACKGELLMTLCLVQINLRTGDMRISNAGHEAPFLLQPLREPSIRLKQNPQHIEPLVITGERLGFDPTSRYTSIHQTLEPQDTLFLYTDGITEMANSKGKELGERGLKKLLLKADLKAVEATKHALAAELQEFGGGGALKDDMTFSIIKWNGLQEAKTEKKVA